MVVFIFLSILLASANSCPFNFSWVTEWQMSLSIVWTSPWEMENKTWWDENWRNIKWLTWILLANPFNSKRSFIDSMKPWWWALQSFSMSLSWLCILLSSLSAKASHSSVSKMALDNQKERWIIHEKYEYDPRIEGVYCHCLPESWAPIIINGFNFL